MVSVIVVVGLRLVVISLIVIDGWLLIITVGWLNRLLNGSLSIVVYRLNWLLVGVIVVCVLIVSLVVLLVIVVVLLIVSLIVLIIVIAVLLLSRSWFCSSTYKVRIAHSIVISDWLTHLNRRFLLSAIKII